MLVRDGEDYSIHLISKGELTLPLWNPLCSKPGLSVPLGGRGPGAQWAPPRTDRGGSRDRSPLKNFILEKDFPLPYPKGTDYISPVLREGAGGGPLPSRQWRDTVSPAGSGPAPQWGASRTDGRGNGDRRWTVATGDHRPQRGRQARRWPGRAGPEGVLAERSRRGDKIPAGRAQRNFPAPRGHAPVDKPWFPCYARCQ